MKTTAEMPSRTDFEEIGMPVSFLTTEDPAVAGPHNPINEIVERKTHLMSMAILKALRHEPKSYAELRAEVVGRSRSALFQMALDRLVADHMVEHNVEADEIAQIF